MSRRGATLIESVIAIFIVSVVLVTFLEALNIGITGTLTVNRKTTALNYAKSEIEHVKGMDYNASTGNITTIYGSYLTVGNVTDVINYNISGQVANVSLSANESLQQITVNVSYLLGKQVQLIGYKTADGELTEPASKGLLVTDNLLNVPNLPQGYSFLCAGQFKGYYHIFNVSTAGYISMTWKFRWSRVSSTASMGAPMMAVYGPRSGGEPWASRDYLDQVRDTGIVVRNQNRGAFDLIGIGDLPGPGGGAAMCDCCDVGGDVGRTYCDNESDPIAYAPHHCGLFQGWLICALGLYFGSYPCCGACWGSNDAGSIFWTYDSTLSKKNGYVEHTLLTDAAVQPGTYTVLFFNGEDNINLDTISASVTYWH